jgi:hypothetical protein
MARSRSYNPDKVLVEFVTDRRAKWKPYERVISGTEYEYKVRDNNFYRLNNWTFVVQVPNDPSGEINVRPIRVPNRRVWAKEVRRALVYPRATKNPHKKKAYCKISLADPTGQKNKRGVRSEERNELPSWFEPFQYRLKEKLTVTTTDGTDGNALIYAIEPQKHIDMIRLYFACRVWVLEEEFMLDRHRDN